jgi:hypothetical protein
LPNFAVLARGTLHQFAWTLMYRSYAEVKASRGKVCNTSCFVVVFI